MDVPDARRLRELEGENAKLKKLLAEAHLAFRRSLGTIQGLDNEARCHDAVLAFTGAYMPKRRGA